MHTVRVAENQLKILIERLALALETDEDFDVDQALKVIEQAKASLQETYQHYQKACPPEAQIAAECLKNSVTLFYGALTSLEEYIETCEEELLPTARAEAAKASEQLEAALDWAQAITSTDNPEQVL